ncbi:hypothetical protein [Actinomadura sp. GTD37]
MQRAKIVARRPRRFRDRPPGMRQAGTAAVYDGPRALLDDRDATPLA